MTPGRFRLPILIAGLIVAVLAAPVVAAEEGSRSSHRFETPPASTPAFILAAGETGGPLHRFMEFYGRLSRLHQICLIAAVAGALIALIGQFLLIVAGFGESVQWGICFLLFPFISMIVFAVMHWNYARSGFVTALAGKSVVLGSALVAMGVIG